MFLLNKYIVFVHISTKCTDKYGPYILGVEIRKW